MVPDRYVYIVLNIWKLGIKIRIMIRIFRAPALKASNVEARALYKFGLLYQTNQSQSIVAIGTTFLA